MEDVGNLGEKKARGKNIAVNTIELRNWKQLLLSLFYMEELLETNGASAQEVWFS